MRTITNQPMTAGISKLIEDPWIEEMFTDLRDCFDSGWPCCGEPPHMLVDMNFSHRFEPSPHAYKRPRL
jgi:hypothetical protein